MYQLYISYVIAMSSLHRCDIPVVLMGETGCGKTRLIRYMCAVAVQQSKRENLVVCKVCAHDALMFCSGSLLAKLYLF